MPTFDFRCNECGHKFSDLVAIKDKEKVKCPKCGGKVSQLFTGFFYKGGNSSSCSGTSCKTCKGCN